MTFLSKQRLIFLVILVCLSGPSFAGLMTIEHEVQDIWWWNGTPESNGTELRTNDVTKSNQRIGVQFNDLTALAGLKITSVELQLYRYSGYWGSDADMTIEAYKIMSSWHESSLIPSYDNYPVTSTTYTDAEARGWQSWNITELVQGWVAGEVVNNGVMLAGIGDNYFQRFYSTKWAGYGPRLIISTVEVPEPKNIIILLSAYMMFLISRRKKANYKPVD